MLRSGAASNFKRNPLKKVAFVDASEKKDQRSSNEFSMSLEVKTWFLFCIALHCIASPPTLNSQQSLSISQRHSSSWIFPWSFVIVVMHKIHFLFFFNPVFCWYSIEVLATRAICVYEKDFAEFELWIVRARWNFSIFRTAVAFFFEFKYQSIEKTTACHFVQRSIGIHFRFSFYWASLNRNNTHTIYWNIQSRRIEKDWIKWMFQSHWMCHKKMVRLRV